MKKIQPFYRDNHTHKDVYNSFTIPGILTGIEGLIHPVGLSPVNSR